VSRKPLHKPGQFRRFFSALGPGVTAGAADDDPSGIATYSIVGAQLGTSLLWTALITWPLMACVQFMCARIGMVTGMGLGDALRRKGPRSLLFFGAGALLIANTINVGADLSGMADAAAMLTGINSHTAWNYSRCLERQSAKSAFLHGGNQWFARAIFACRYSRRGI
jgi:Mn2+/Fe2+ NRAMP family transporter